MTPFVDASRPPRTWEALLEGFGANRTYTQDLIGDLAEEFALRAERDDQRSARRWYRRQALRSVPHLFIDWFRTARRHDYLSALTAVWIAYFCVALMGLMGLAFLRSIAAATGYAPQLLANSPMAAFVLAMIVALGCGYIVAALARDAPLIAAFAFVVLATAINLAGAAIGALHLWGVPRSPVSSITVVAIWLLMAPSGAILRTTIASRETAGPQ